MVEYALIKVRPETKKVTSRLAKKHSLNMLDFMEAMAEYFDTTGVNPKDQVILSPAEELKKLRDTLVSFMRKQENDFIKPTFGKMDTLIARFIKYIEEEAPKKDDAGGQNKLKNIVASSKILPGENKEIHENENVKSETKSEEYNLLLEKYETLELKFSITKKYFEKVLSHVQEKSTGLTKKPVIELPMGDIDEYKMYLKKL
jgi:hypothetical protein